MTDSTAFDDQVEKAVLGACLLTADARRVTSLLTRGLRPHHFYADAHGKVFKAMAALADRQAQVDAITVAAEIDRMGMRDVISRRYVDEMTAYVPAAGHVAEYADRVMELARWRDRQTAIHRQQIAVTRRNEVEWARATAELDAATTGTRTESLTAEQWGSILFDRLSGGEEASDTMIPTPFSRLSEGLGGGLDRGEWCALSGPSSHGKSIFADMWLDHAARRGVRCHLYMTEMTAVQRGMRYLSRQTGVPFMAMRRGRLSEKQTTTVLAELDRLMYGCTIAADWSMDDIVRDALRARYDFVVIDLLHGFHYEDERGLDRLSKGVQRLARASTTLDGHSGTAVLAVTHLKEEGLVHGKVPRPNVTSIKGGSSIKQDADFVCFVWQDQDEHGATTGEGEVWFAKGRSGEMERELIRLLPSRFLFTQRSEMLR